MGADGIRLRYYQRVAALEGIMQPWLRALKNGANSNSLPNSSNGCNTQKDGLDHRLALHLVQSKHGLQLVCLLDENNFPDKVGVGAGDVVDVHAPSNIVSHLQACGYTTKTRGRPLFGDCRCATVFVSP